MKIELLKCDDNSVLDLIARVSVSTRKNGLIVKWKEKISQEEFIRRLKKMKHFGVLEHITFTFHISEISRNLTHELVRHRIASYLQMSNRQVILKSNDFVIPPTVKNGVFENKFKVSMINAWSNYHEAMEAGIPVEDARYLLPSGYFTHITLTMNCRELRHFFELRCDKAAQWEIREMANEMLKICHEKFPVIFEDLYDKYTKN